MGNKSLIYYLANTGIYVLLGFIETLVCPFIIDMFTVSSLMHLLVYGVLFILINPIATRIITNHLEFLYPKKERTE
ncbi:MAG: hypothetical protein Q4D13_04330 [Erysipelotrichaceae bacterium]|nr:hypothetical protein [Erysipelotrichaceae bacterium]